MNDYVVTRLDPVFINVQAQDIHAAEIVAKQLVVEAAGQKLLSIVQTQEPLAA
jgi:hypothetical protein